MSLYEKYRPKGFDEIVGNSQTLAAIEGFLRLENHNHTILLIGPSGCGKTTLGRIISQKLGAVGNDLHEYNAANLRGIDQTRDIIEQMRLMPLMSPCKVWLIEEAAKMSNDAQTAFLKPFEDTPKHVYFILTTTDPQKLSPAIKSRCTTFNVQALPERRISHIIQTIVDKEGKIIPDLVKHHIAKNSQGSPRLAIEMLERVIELEPDKQMKAADQVEKEEAQLKELCQALYKREPWPKVTQILQNLETDAEATRMGVLNYFNKILLGSDDPNAYLILDIFKESFYYLGKPGLTRACYEVLMPFKTDKPF